MYCGELNENLAGEKALRGELKTPDEALQFVDRFFAGQRDEKKNFVNRT